MRILAFWIAIIVAGLAQAQDAAPQRPVIGAAVAPSETRADVAGVVTDVRAGYPAAEAGLEVGDLITTLNGVAARTPQEIADAIAASVAGEAVAPLRIGVLRGDRPLFVEMTPWLTPDPVRDAELFPYPQDLAPSTSFFARIGDGDYAHMAAARVFAPMRMLGFDDSLLNRRIAFRARLRSCADIAALRGAASTPNSEISPGLDLTPSLLFSYAAAAEQRRACEAHFESNGLLYSSPLVVVAGRFVQDVDHALSHEGGEIFLTDAVLFDHATVSLGSEIVSLVEMMARMGLFSQ